MNKQNNQNNNNNLANNFRHIGSLLIFFFTDYKYI